MRKVTFADGTAFDCNNCGASDNVLWLGLVTDFDFLAAVTYLCNEENTQTIKYQYTDDAQKAAVFDGYTALSFVQKQADGYLIALRKMEVADK